MGDPRPARVPDFLAVHDIAFAIECGKICQVGRCHVRWVKSATNAQRIEHNALHQAIKTLAAHPLHHRGDYSPVQISIAEIVAGPGVFRPHRALAKPCATGREHVLQVDVQFVLPVVVGLIRDRRPMREQHAHRDRRIGEVRIAQRPAEIGAHIGVQRQLALLHQTHDTERGDELGDGGDAIPGVGVCCDVFFRRCAVNKFAAKLACVGHAAIANHER